MLSFQKLNYMLFIDTIISLKAELLEFIKGFMFVFIICFTFFSHVGTFPWLDQLFIRG